MNKSKLKISTLLVNIHVILFLVSEALGFYLCKQDLNAVVS